jgi:hypothetical protein
MFSTGFFTTIEIDLTNGYKHLVREPDFSTDHYRQFYHDGLVVD